MPATDANAIGAANFSRTARRDEKDRLSLIADAKKRQFGIDKDALDRQVAEKEAAKAAEKQRDLCVRTPGMLLPAVLRPACDLAVCDLAQLL